ncbi:hypothetical protein BD413DRAFT_551195 [Trametes elegans]|nr:hypothetical protein BD413DRAFT_551195 [Trametes elegans]
MAASSSSALMARSVAASGVAAASPMTISSSTDTEDTNREAHTSIEMSSTRTMSRTSSADTTSIEGYDSILMATGGSWASTIFSTTTVAATISSSVARSSVTRGWASTNEGNVSCSSYASCLTVGRRSSNCAIGPSTTSVLTSGVKVSSATTRWISAATGISMNAVMSHMTSCSSSGVRMHRLTPCPVRPSGSTRAWRFRISTRA